MMEIRQLLSAQRRRVAGRIIASSGRHFWEFSGQREEIFGLASPGFTGGGGGFWLLGRGGIARGLADARNEALVARSMAARVSCELSRSAALEQEQDDDEEISVRKKKVEEAAVEGLTSAKEAKEVSAPKKSLAQKTWSILFGIGPALRAIASTSRISSGKLFRFERKQLTRTAGFMEFLLKPNMLPSTFQDKQEVLKKRLNARMEYARFLQETVEEMAKEVKTKTNSSEVQRTAQDLAEFLTKVRTGKKVENDDILAFAKFYNTLDNVSRPRLLTMCKYMGVKPFGTDAYLRYSLRQHLARVKADDRMIQNEGIDALSEPELIAACRERGILEATSADDLQSQMKEEAEDEQEEQERLRKQEEAAQVDRALLEMKVANGKEAQEKTKEQQELSAALAAPASSVSKEFLRLFNNGGEQKWRLSGWMRKRMGYDPSTVVPRSPATKWHVRSTSTGSSTGSCGEDTPEENQLAPSWFTYDVLLLDVNEANLRFLNDLLGKVYLKKATNDEIVWPQVMKIFGLMRRIAVSLVVRDVVTHEQIHVHFIVDTGAPGVYLSSTVLSRLNIPDDESSGFTDRFEVHGVHMDWVYKSTSHFKEANLLGTSYLIDGRLNMTTDFREKKKNLLLTA